MMAFPSWVCRWREQGSVRDGAPAAKSLQRQRLQSLKVLWAGPLHKGGPCRFTRPSCKLLQPEPLPEDLERDADPTEGGAHLRALDHRPHPLEHLARDAHALFE